MTYIQYSTINNLEEISFIAGHTKLLEFTLYDENGNQITTTGKSLEWRLAPYGEKSYVSIVKTEGNGGVTDLDEYTKLVTLTPSDTESLSGKFVQQPIVTDLTDNIQYKPSQGIVTIISAIPSS